MVLKRGLFGSFLLFTFFAFGIVAINCPARAWGPEGHEMVGSIADRLLTTNARQQISQILGVDLRTAGPWLDCVKSVRQQNDGSFKYVENPKFEPPCTPFKDDRGRMEDYARRNWFDCFYSTNGTDNAGCHNTYHFDDVDIQRDRFDRNDQGTNNHDLVAAINAAIAVLLDRPAPPPSSIKDKKEALLMLAHLVGDLTQPLHVGAVYLDNSGDLVDPDVTHTIDPGTETLGGNAILDMGANLHAEWDNIPVDLQDGNATPELVQAAKDQPGNGDRIENWSAAWATDTLLVAQQAFAGLSFVKGDNNKWLVSFSDRDAYVREADTIKRRQLAKGGAHLAAIMNSIWP